MNQTADIATQIFELDLLSPAGFALGLQIDYTTPRFMFQTYPKKWLEVYNAKGLLMYDPVVQWGFQNTGAVRWRDLRDDDPKGVMTQAARYGMCYGITFSTTHGKSRSVGGFARSDRDYLDVEIDELAATVMQLHKMTAKLTKLSNPDVIALKRMSNRLTRS